MSKLFDYGQIRNHPRRAGFDLSKKRAFTAKAGEILPVFWKLTFPGDKFRFSVQHFTRTQPVNTAAFTRIREYFDAYFVPLRLLNKNIGQALVQMTENPVQALSLTENRAIELDIPYTSLKNLSRAFTQSLSSSSISSPLIPSDVNQFGFSIAATQAKLIQYMGYGNVVQPGSSWVPGNFPITTTNDYVWEFGQNYNVNLLPLLAYQKIYADFFRFQQWERNEPYTYNADYYAGGDFFSPLSGTTSVWRDYFISNNIFTLRYANWKKDMFMGVLPEQQFGDVSTVALTPGQDPQKLFVYDMASNAKIGDSYVSYYQENASTASNQKLVGAAPAEFPVGGTSANPTAYIGFDPVATAASFNIIQLRLAEAVQRWKEITQCHDQTYREQIYAHFGVRLSAALADECVYVGGGASNLDISEVVNQSLTGDADANIKGKGVGTGNLSGSLSCQEHGVFMILYHVAPVLDYVLTAPDMQLFYTSTEDFPQPEYDSIGMQAMPFGYLLNGSNDVENFPNIDQQTFLQSTMGYVPRYIELKTSVDDIQGAFLTTLRHWVAPLDPSYVADWMEKSITTGQSAYELNYNFFKINPHVLDSIFGNDMTSDWDSDPFLVNCFINCKAVRNFDYDGMPY